MRAHKLTFQALWRLLLPQFLDYLEQHESDFKQELDNAVASADDTELIAFVSTDRFQAVTSKFMSTLKDNVNFAFWWQYMEMVSVLLMFTRAQRDGI